MVGQLCAAHTPTGECLFLDSPSADCKFSDLIGVEKFEETLPGLRHHPGKVSRN